MATPCGPLIPQSFAPASGNPLCRLCFPCTGLSRVCSSNFFFYKHKSHWTGVQLHITTACIFGRLGWIAALLQPGTQSCSVPPGDAQDVDDCIILPCTVHCTVVLDEPHHCSQASLQRGQTWGIELMLT